jgi:hypothetical protein
MEIEVKALSTYSVAADGRNITLRVTGAGNSDVGLTMDVDQLGTLVMTLPALIEIALKRRFQDASLRYSYALGPSSLEQASDPHSLIFTLQTCDGFGVSFKISRQQADDLSEMLASAAVKRSEIVAH